MVDIYLLIVELSPVFAIPEITCAEIDRSPDAVTTTGAVANISRISVSS
jgi:hypothetical protein